MICGACVGGRVDPNVPTLLFTVASVAGEGAGAVGRRHACVRRGLCSPEAWCRRHQRACRQDRWFVRDGRSGGGATSIGFHSRDPALGCRKPDGRITNLAASPCRHPERRRWFQPAYDAAWMTRCPSRRRYCFDRIGLRRARSYCPDSVLLVGIWRQIVHALPLRLCIATRSHLRKERLPVDEPAFS